MLVADFLEMGDFDEAEFGVQGDAGLLVGVDAAEDGVVADFFGEFEEFAEHRKRTGQHHPMRKKVGKLAELASGYQGWVGAWKAFGADEFFSDDEIKEAILAWRAASPSIVEPRCCFIITEQHAL